MIVNEKNVILMLGFQGNEFYLKINGKLIPTGHMISNYHAMLWLKDKVFKEKTAKAILIQYIHLIR